MSDDTIRRRWRPRLTRNRSASAVLVTVLLGGVLVAAMGAGYQVSRSTLDNGSATVAKGHTVANVNAETGKSDAEVALALATGKEKLQTVRLPDGRLVIVNKDTGKVSVIDSATMTPTGETATGSGKDKVDALSTDSDGYLVDRGRNTVQVVGGPQGPAPQPVRVDEGIIAAVPVGDSVWVITKSGTVVEIVAGQQRRVVQVAGKARAITVADGHPAVVTEDGTAYLVDGDEPRTLGSTGLTGPRIVLGTWQGAGRWLVAVDPPAGQVVGLDPRTGRQVSVQLPNANAKSDLAAPVVLGDVAFVPDYSGPRLWRVNLATGSADKKTLTVNGEPGAFDLKVQSGLVWASSQYDRRVLVIDRSGTARYADKGEGAGVSDHDESAGKDTPQGKPSTPPTTPPQNPPAGSTPPAGQNGTTPPNAERVSVPSFPAGTPYQTACNQLVALRLRCNPVSSGTRSGRQTGDVIDTNPPAGSSVPVQSRVQVRYVGPVTVPAVTGLDKDGACSAVRTAGLACATAIDPTVATSPAQLGVVSAQNPAAGREIDKGATVTITYRNRIPLQSVVGMPHAEACKQLTDQYKLKCTEKVNLPGGTNKPPGQVYEQDPVPSTVVTIGSAVTVTYYAGSGPVGDYVHLTGTDACAQAVQAGFGCTQTTGDTALNTGYQPGVVYKQTPAPGTNANVGTTIVLTVYSDKNTLLGYANADVTAACNDVRARGFACNPVPVLNPANQNAVVGQSPGPGDAPLGTVVTLQYSGWQAVEFSVYKHNTQNVWVLRPTGQIPSGYGAASRVIGRAYPDGSNIPGGRTINGFTCTSGGTKCGGLPVNHFYSRVGSYTDPDYTGPVAIATFMDCGSGGRHIYRTWTESGGIRFFYNVTDNPAGATGQEDLGCVW